MIHPGRKLSNMLLQNSGVQLLRSLLMRVKDESDKAVLKLNIKNAKIMATNPITSRKIERERVEAMTDFLFLGFKITADCDCGHEIRRWLLFCRKDMTNWDSVLKSKSITLLTKAQIVKVMVFTSSRVQLWGLDHKEGRALKNRFFWTIVLEKTLESLLDRKDIKPINLKGNLPWVAHWKKRCWSSNTLAISLEKILRLRKIEGRKRRGWQRMRWWNAITDSLDMNLDKLQKMVKDREA